MPESTSERGQSKRPQSSKPKKRNITTARREQNRAAQRTWRQRQKELQKSALSRDDVSSLASRTRTPQLGPSPLHLTRLDAVNQPAESGPYRYGLNYQVGYPDSDLKVSDHAELTIEASLETPRPDVLDGVHPTIPGPILHFYQGQEVTSEDSSSSTLSPEPQNTLSLLHADPKVNILQTNQTKTVSAVLKNAVCLGFDIQKLMTCDKADISPFFRAFTPTDNPRSLVASTLDPSLPTHLQPTMAQILIPHPASLDLIPLPLLRERVIMISFAMPEVFDLWDLKLDIYVRDGLVISGTKNCSSWDQNYWEMKPWFKRKWCEVIGE